MFCNFLALNVRLKTHKMSCERAVSLREAPRNDCSTIKRMKSREFVQPIGHLKRHFVPTSAAISHVNEPTFFQKFTRNEQSHYRREFQQKPLSSPPVRATSPNRRNKPHPVQVYHLQRLRSGLVCDVRTKPQANDEKKSSVSFNSCTKSAYPANKLEQAMKGTLLHRESSELPAIGIVPGTILVVSEETQGIDEHWLPGSLKLTTPLTVRGKYEYFPRKRKLIIKREDAAGIKCPAEFGNRYHEQPRRRGRRPAQMTIRAGA